MPGQLDLTSPPRVFADPTDPLHLIRKSWADPQFQAALARVAPPRDPALSLGAWRAALAGRAGAPADVLVIGDSHTEGAGASTKTNRFVEKLRTYLRAAAPTGLIPGGEGYVPAMNASTSFNNGWTYAGAVAGDGTLGFGHRTAILQGPDGAITRTVSGTSITIAHTVAAGTGTYQVFLDGSGTAAATVDTSVGGTGTARDTGRTTVSLGARGNHTVKIAWSAGAACYVNGLFVFDGDENAGVRVTECGQHGSNSAAWSPSTNPMGYILADDITLLQPDLVIIELGSNDLLGNQPSSAFKTNIQALISQIRGACTVAPSIVLLAAFTQVGTFFEPWQSYVDRMREIVAADVGVSLIDLSVLMPGAGLTNYGLMYSDGVHASDAGHDLIARTVAAAVLPSLRYGEDVTAPGVGDSMQFTSSGLWAPRSAVPAGISPGSVANIGPRPGQNHFQIQTVQDGAPAIETHTQTELANGWELAPFLTTSADGRAVQTQVSVGSATTSGSNYPRTEFRECGLDGLPIAFDALTGIHRLIFDFRILVTPSNTGGRDIVVGQLHNGDTDRLAIRAQDVSGTRRGRLRVNGTSVYEFANPLVLGTWYRCMLELVNNTVNVYFAADGAAFPGSPQYTLAAALTATAGGATWYHKWGCYLQTSVANGGIATEYGRVEHRNISHWHSGWPTPAKFYAVPGHAATHALGGQDDLSSLYVPWTNVGAAGGVASLDANGRQLASQEPLVTSAIRAGSVSSSLTSDASAGGNLINLAITGTAVINPPTNPVDFQMLRYHCVASGAARSVTFGSGVLPSTGVGLGPYNLTRGQVLVALLEYIGNKATTADVAAPAWGLLAATIVG